VTIGSGAKAAWDVTAFKASNQAEEAGADPAGALLNMVNLGTPAPVHGMWAVGGDTPAP
jgi:hypothetical protein